MFQELLIYSQLPNIWGNVWALLWLRHRFVELVCMSDNSEEKLHKLFPASFTLYYMIEGTYTSLLQTASLCPFKIRLLKS